MGAALPTLAAALWLALAQAGAPIAPAPPKPPKVLIELVAADVDARRIIAPPPARGDASERAEIADLHRLAASVSPTRFAQARWDDDHEDPSLFQPTLGAGFDMKALPTTAELLALVQTDADVSASAAKKIFGRPRPWVVDSTIKTCDPQDKPMTSYPSGHATLGYSLAITLATVLPARAEALMTRAADYALSRQICGSHFASDTEASHALAATIVATLLTRPAFQAKLAAARAELVAKGF